MKDFSAILCFSLIWWLMLPIVCFWGDFPLNDDWAYGENAYYLSEKNEIHFSSWPAMTLLAQTAWGALFCKIFGFSFTVLRFSTLFMAWLGGMAWFKLVRLLGGSPVMAAITTLIWLFNPLFFSLAYTFMTDVHFLSVSVISIYFFTAYIYEPRWWSFAAAVFFMIAATLIRQTAFFIPLFFAVAILIQQGVRWKSLLLAVFPMGLAVCTLAMYTYWRESVYGLPPSWGSIQKPIKKVFNGNLFQQLSSRPAILLFYAGYFLMPIVVLLMPIVWQIVSKKRLIAAAALSLGLSVYWFYFNGIWGWLPQYGVFYNLGLGTKVLLDTQFYGVNVEPTMSVGAMYAFKIVGVATGTVLLYAVFSILFGLRSFLLTRQQLALFLGSLFAGISYASYLMVDEYFFDRYFLGFHLFIFIALLPIINKYTTNNHKIISGVTLLVWLGLSWFGVAATHDYLAWNRARWKGLDYLTDTLQIPAARIDGGFEFNGWNQRHRERAHIPNSTGWWFVDKDDYAITFGSFRNYEVIKTCSFSAWLEGFQQDSIFVLKKPEPFAIDTFRCDMEQVESMGRYFIGTDNKTWFGGGAQQSGSHARSGKHSMWLAGKKNMALQLTLPFIRPYDEYIISGWVYGEKTGWGGLHGHTHLVGSTVNKGYGFYSFNHFNVRDSSGWYYKEHRIVAPAEYADTVFQTFVKLTLPDTVWVDDWQVLHVRYKEE